MALFRRSRSGRRRGGMSRFTAGLIAVVVISVLSFFGFTKANPFANPFKLEAVFENVDNVRPNSPVRIAGVEIGKVTKIEALDGEQQGGRVTMELKKNALPIHEDATVKVRPRIFLEGNKFIEIRPGSPASPTIETDHVVPIQQTSSSVSFGDVLTALQSDTREDLKTLLKEFSQGLAGKGARGFNQSIKYWPSAYKNLSLVNDATLGQQPTKDVQRVLKGQQKTFSALVEDEEALKGLVTNLAITTGAFARQDQALEASIPELRDTLRAARPALFSLNAALPSVRAFAVDALPGVRSSGPTLRRSLPFITQLRKLFSRRELRGAARVLRRYTPALVRLTQTSVPLLEQARTLSACTNSTLVPFANDGIPWPEFPELNNQPLRRQAPRGLTGLAGESRLSDGNLSYFHGQAGPPPTPGLTQHSSGNAIRPAPPPFPSSGRMPTPQHRPDVPCETQEPPNLSAPGNPTSAYTSRGSRGVDRGALQRAASQLRRADVPEFKKSLELFRGFTVGTPERSLRRSREIEKKRIERRERREREQAQKKEGSG